MTPSGTQQTRTITAFFDSRTDADEAVRRLHAAGFAQSAVRLTPGYQGRPERDVNPDSYRGAYENNEGFGFWEALKDLFLPEEDRHAYAEGLRRGGYLVTVQTGDASYARALDILDDEGTIDLDERAASWRSEGPRRGARKGGPATPDRTTVQARPRRPQVSRRSAQAHVVAVPAKRRADDPVRRRERQVQPRPLAPPRSIARGKR